METQGNPHLTVDLSGCPAEKLGDVALIFNLLEELPAQLGMTQISTPSVFRYTGKDAGEWGVTGVVLVEDSHISIHTFPERGRAFIDIFSCRDFDTDLAKARLLEVFNARDHELTMINRSMESSAALEERVTPRVYH
jgi:S-adenosylmethionine decarboxylase